MPTLPKTKTRTRSKDGSAMVTMRQVAREAGVSYTTVSFVINGNDTARGIGAATRERVLETAKRLGYRHNGLARAVSTGKSQVLAVAVQTLELDFRAKILSGVLEAAEAAGYFVKVVSLPSYEIPREKTAQLVESRVAGVIAVNIEPESLKHLRGEMERYGGLVATVDDIDPQDGGIRVSSDNTGGIQTAFQHLRELGHHKIALLSGPEASTLARERYQAFVALVEGEKLPKYPVIKTREDWNLTEEMEAQICEILNSHRRPTAYLCMGDLLAMRVLKIARSLGLEVPRDLSIVGYGNFTISEISVPSLSSVNQPFHQMGFLGTHELLRALETKALAAPNSKVADDMLDDVTKVLPVNLIVRESSGPAPTELLF